MVRFISRLLVAAVSFVSFLFTTNPAIAATPLKNPTQQTSIPIVNLSLTSHSLSAFNVDSPQNHLGCSCAACLANLEQNQG